MSKVSQPRDRTTKRNVSEADLLALYTLYPRKRGKTLGLAKARRQIMSLEALADFKQAIENYVRIIEAEGTEPQYVMYFSTFMNCWQDYLEEDVVAQAKVLNLSDVFKVKA